MGGQERTVNRPLSKKLDELTDRILESYKSDGRTQRIGQAFLPSRERIVLLLEELKLLLFPGYFGPAKLTAENVRYHAGTRLSEAGDALVEQVYHCICSSKVECKGDTCTECRIEAQEKTIEFLSRIPKVRDMLALDAQAAYDGDPAAKSIEEIIYCYPGFHAMVVYRLAHELVDLEVPLMPRILSEHAHATTGVDIHPGATIGKSFFIDHGTGVVIGETCRIGNNVKMYQGVTLGAKSFPKDERGRAIKGLQRHPTIEDDVTIYAGATILGGDTVIGRGVTVSGNTFVMESITEGSLVHHEAPKLHVRSKPSR
jgi:serine O-acetyltransferase